VRVFTGIESEGEEAESRTANMKVITAIYLNCRPDLRDEWLTSNEIDNEVEDSLVSSDTASRICFYLICDCLALSRVNRHCVRSSSSSTGNTTKYLLLICTGALQARQSLSMPRMASCLQELEVFRRVRARLMMQARSRRCVPLHLWAPTITSGRPISPIR
jgi:hypothetical protein